VPTKSHLSILGKRGIEGPLNSPYMNKVRPRIHPFRHKGE
jgi:hypothetical protein